MADLGRDANPLGAGLDRYVRCSRGFRGKEAMQETGIRSRCVTLLIDGPEDADLRGREALYDGDSAGSVSLGRQIGIGYVVPDNARPGPPLSVRMLDRMWPADSPWDPQNAALKVDG